METVFSDLRFAARQLIRGKSGTIFAILTLALGISANTSMFTLVNATLFKAPAAADPHRLAWISQGDALNAVSSLSYPDFQAIRRQTKTLSGVMAFGGKHISLGGAVPERINALIVSGNYFDVLGLHASVGRTFSPEEDSIASAHPVVVLSNELWVRRFNSDSHITDSTIIVNGARYNVVGVAPPNFGGLDFDEPSEMFVPLAMIAQIMPGQEGLLKEERAGWLRVVARLAPKSSTQQAQAEVAQIAKQFDTPTTKAENRKTFAVSLLKGGLDPSNRREIAPVVLMLSLVPLLVLMVACANAANMQMAQGLARRREFAVRRALGASRSRLLRQLLTESMLLALCAGGLGVLLSFWLTVAILRLGDAPVFLDSLLNPDAFVLAATTALAMLTGICFGIAPALAATSPALAPALKDEGGTVVIGRQRHRLRSVLVTAQVSVSLVLVVTAGLFVRSLTKAMDVEPGFDVQHTATVSFDLGMQGYSKSARESFENILLDRARALPGVTAVSFSSTLPLSGRTWGTAVQTSTETSPDKGAEVRYASVGADYLKTMGIPLVRGRDFDVNDKKSTALVVIIDETLAHKLWPNDSPIGKQLRIAERGEPLREVVGIARNGHYDSLIEQPRGFFYLPYAQYGSFESSLSLVVRSSASPAGLIAPLSQTIKTLDPNLPLYKVQTMSQSISQIVDKQRAVAALLGIFGTLALVLAAFGMYGVSSHGVNLRRREIGIRMSLGAHTADVLRLFVGEGLRLSLIGVTVGLALSAALSKVLAGFLFGLTATDSLTFVSGALVLSIVAVIASYVPARRAASVDPLTALRAD